MSQGSMPPQLQPLSLPTNNFDLLESWLEPMSAAQVHSLLVDIACSIPEAFERIRDRVRGGGRKIFVKNISFDTSSDTIRKYFEQYGLVEEAVVVYDRAKKKSRGYGFVTFCNVMSVSLALKHHIHLIDGRETEASLAVPDKEVPTNFFQPSSSFGSFQFQGTQQSVPSQNFHGHQPQLSQGLSAGYQQPNVNTSPNRMYDPSYMQNRQFVPDYNTNHRSPTQYQRNPVQFSAQSQYPYIQTATPATTNLSTLMSHNYSNQLQPQKYSPETRYGNGVDRFNSVNQANNSNDPLLVQLQNLGFSDLKNSSDIDSENSKYSSSSHSPFQQSPPMYANGLMIDPSWANAAFPRSGNIQPYPNHTQNQSNVVPSSNIATHQQGAYFPQKGPNYNESNQLSNPAQWNNQQQMSGEPRDINNSSSSVEAHDL